jgi:hypothetical protein
MTMSRPARNLPARADQDCRLEGDVGIGLADPAGELGHHAYERLAARATAVRVASARC